MSKYYSHGMAPYVYNWPGRAYSGSRVSNSSLGDAFDDITNRLREAGKALIAPPAAPAAPAPTKASSTIFGLPVIAAGALAVGAAVYLSKKRKRK